MRSKAGGQVLETNGRNDGCSVLLLVLRLFFICLEAHSNPEYDVDKVELGWFQTCEASRIVSGLERAPRSNSIFNGASERPDRKESMPWVPKYSEVRLTIVRSL